MSGQRTRAGQSDARRQDPAHEPRQAPVPHEAVRYRTRIARLFLTPVALATTLLALTGCGYSLSSKSNPHIATVAVPIFKNETLEKGIEDMLTQEIIDVLQENRQLKLTDQNRADSVIYGTIVDYKRTPYSYDSSENVQEYKVEIIARIEYEDRKKQKTLWQAPRMLGWSTYFAIAVAGQEVEDEIDAQQRAAAKLAEDVKTKTVEGW